MSELIIVYIPLYPVDFPLCHFSGAVYREMTFLDNPPKENN